MGIGGGGAMDPARSLVASAVIDPVAISDHDTRRTAGRHRHQHRALATAAPPTRTAVRSARVPPKAAIERSGAGSISAVPRPMSKGRARRRRRTQGATLNELACSYDISRSIISSLTV
jgi:hypothetical protein